MKGIHTDNERAIAAITAEARRRHMSYGKYVYVATAEELREAVASFRPLGKKEVTVPEPEKKPKANGRPRKLESLLQDQPHQSTMRQTYVTAYRQRLRERLQGRQRAAILAWLEAMQITQLEAAELVGVSYRCFSGWATENSPAKWDKMAAAGCRRPEGLE